MTDQTKITVPPGCLGIYTDEEGRIIASVSDFDRSGYGGFTLYQGQRIRAEKALAHEIVRAYCSDVVARSLDTYGCEQIVRKLKGKMTFIPVGHTDETR